MEIYEFERECAKWLSPIGMELYAETINQETLIYKRKNSGSTAVSVRCSFNDGIASGVIIKELMFKSLEVSSIPLKVGENIEEVAEIVDYLDKMNDDFKVTIIATLDKKGL